MEKSKEKKEKTPAPAIDSFPTDETPTPTKGWVGTENLQFSKSYFNFHFITFLSLFEFLLNFFLRFYGWLTWTSFKI